MIYGRKYSQFFADENIHIEEKHRCITTLLGWLDSQYLYHRRIVARLLFYSTTVGCGVSLWTEEHFEKFSKKVYPSRFSIQNLYGRSANAQNPIIDIEVWGLWFALLGYNLQNPSQIESFQNEEMFQKLAQCKEDVFLTILMKKDTTLTKSIFDTACLYLQKEPDILMIPKVFSSFLETFVAHSSEYLVRQIFEGILGSDKFSKHLFHIYTDFY